MTIIESVRQYSYLRAQPPYARFLVSFSFDWEDMSNTQDIVWPYFQTCSSKFVKNTPLLVLFSNLYSAFGNVFTHGLSCLISFIIEDFDQRTSLGSYYKSRQSPWNEPPPPPISATGAFAHLLSSWPCTYLPMTLRSLSRILLKWGRLSGSSSQHCVIRDWSSDLQVFSLTTGRNGGSSCAITRAMISAQRIPDVF